MNLEIGDVVKVLTRNGEIGYFGEVVELPASLGSLEGVGRVGVQTPDDGEIHSVPLAYVREATEAESDDYIERWVDAEFKRNE